MEEIKLEGLKIIVHGREQPDIYDYYDGNWISVTASYSRSLTYVEASTSIHLPEIKSWVDQLEILYRTLQGEALLDCMEPELNISIKSEKLGSLQMDLSITPDHMFERHHFISTIDQSYLPDLIQSCKNVLNCYPIRGV